MHFALEIESQDIAIHKSAAIEETHITPLKPVLSLFTARGAVGVAFALLGLGLDRCLG